MCSSRLALDPHNRPVVVVTTGAADIEPGHVFYVLDPHGIGLFEPHGRRPTAREQAEARAPYESSPRRWDKPLEVPDDELDDAQALEAARREQQRTPVDLFQQAYA